MNQSRHCGHFLIFFLLQIFSKNNKRSPMFIPESRVGSLNCNTIHTAWMVKFVINLVLSTLFLPINCWQHWINTNLKFGAVDPLFIYKMADTTTIKIYSIWIRIHTVNLVNRLQLPHIHCYNFQSSTKLILERFENCC